jgi:hypothetical protein
MGPADFPALSVLAAQSPGLHGHSDGSRAGNRATAHGAGAGLLSITRPNGCSERTALLSPKRLDTYLIGVMNYFALAACPTFCYLTRWFIADGADLHWERVERDLRGSSAR